ncbi:MAG: hypothetical protein WCY07_14455 [Pigmentiphaga sp.]
MEIGELVERFLLEKRFENNKGNEGLASGSSRSWNRRVGLFGLFVKQTYIKYDGFYGHPDEWPQVKPSCVVPSRRIQKRKESDGDAGADRVLFRPHFSLWISGVNPD